MEYWLSFLGLVFGVLLGFLTKEEYKPGKKYFEIIRRVVLFLMVVSLLYYSRSFFSAVFFGLGFIVALYFRKSYFYLGLGLVALANFWMMSLIFVFGLVYGTLSSKKYWKDYRKVVFPLFLQLVWVLIPLVFLGFEFEYLSGFAAGALFFIFLAKWENIKKS